MTRAALKHNHSLLTHHPWLQAIVPANRLSQFQRKPDGLPTQVRRVSSSRCRPFTRPGALSLSSKARPSRPPHPNARTAATLSTHRNSRTHCDPRGHSHTGPSLLNPPLTASVQPAALRLPRLLAALPRPTTSCLWHSSRHSSLIINPVTADTKAPHRFHHPSFRTPSEARHSSRTVLRWPHRPPRA